MMKIIFYHGLAITKPYLMCKLLYQRTILSFLDWKDVGFSNYNRQTCDRDIVLSGAGGVISICSFVDQGRGDICVIDVTGRIMSIDSIGGTIFFDAIIIVMSIILLASVPSVFLGCKETLSFF